LFKDTPSYFQKDEYLNLINQIPSQKVRSDYDPHTPEDVDQLTNVFMLNGDYMMPKGLRFTRRPATRWGAW
jgi:hypothetical protein